jgi:hypothetical protein
MFESVGQSIRRIERAITTLPGLARAKAAALASEEATMEKIHWLSRLMTSLPFWEKHLL